MQPNGRALVELQNHKRPIAVVRGSYQLFVWKALKDLLVQALRERFRANQSKSTAFDPDVSLKMGCRNSLSLSQICTL